MSPKIVENHRTATSKSSTHQQKKRQSMDTKFYLKSQNKNCVGIPPCISCVFGARILGRVWIPAFSKKKLKTKWWAFRPVFHVLLVLEI